MSSSTASPGSVQATSRHKHEWNLPDWVPVMKPPTWEYGYIIKRLMFGSTREQLIDMVQQGMHPNFVWTPDTPKPVFPEEVPFLLEAFRRNRAREARKATLWGAGFVLLGILLAVASQDWTLIYRSIFFVFGAVGLTEGIWQYARLRHYTHEDAASDAGTARFAAWLGSRALSRYTFTLAACMVVVGVVQLLAANDPIGVAGLVKPAVWDGQIWRLFTATLIHANLTHFAINFLVLLQSAKIVEQTVQRAFVPLVFLLTAAAGSVFSLLLYPNITSVGASGGLMGLLGFTTIAAHFDRTRYPPRYFRLMIEAIVSVAVLGLFGFAFIDNAGHLGGLVGGVLLGWFFLRKNERLVKKNAKMLELGGLAALLVLGLVTAFAVHRMLF
jgi:membrane associated rhomboid family serine protease